MDKNITIGSPVDGLTITLEEVEDGVFSEKMLGDGIAILPSNEEFYAPISGELVTLFPTGHAYGIRSDDNIEVLVHIGIDTVEIAEPVFKICCKQGKRVKKGDLIIKANLSRLKALGYKQDTMVIITSTDRRVTTSKYQKNVKSGDMIFTVE